MHYLDSAATTMVAPEVITTISQTMEQHYANPASLYAPGFAAERVIQQARKVVADALGCAPKEVYFTGTGTEGCNIATLGMARARKNWGNHLVATAYEHSGVLKPLQMLAEHEGFTLTLVQPEPDGNISIQKLVDAATDKTALVCAMHLNNETGALLDVAEVAKQVKNKNRRTAVHVDGVQAFTKAPLKLGATQIDSYAVSGHKIHAPKGVGALYLRGGLNVLPPLVGGGQESNIRPGTENTPYIAGLAKAVELAHSAHPQTLQTIDSLYHQLLKGIQKLDGITLNSPANAYHGIVNLSLPGIRSETMLHFLEERQVYVSSGSACSKGAASRTLTAMQLPPECIDSALRISFGRYNTKQDIEALLVGLQEGIATLARPAGNKR